ncbi:hypothetical protein TSAR_005432 [Trichomalopsis sarcophagae]|uniref:Uncharacterized protein n=1 Tax=Trichomalopsis sarcophagae TaxID=543379 RepID=A0A232EZ39_9HYME|nr:hypothetical protein TSAR_005432 [Trichomalopsis sarcophagae]
MEPLDEAKLAEQITIYENKIKAIKDKIGDELRTRRDYKEKLREAKRREATQILILERLDEYQKIVNQQIEAAAKMEDTESIKQMAIIEKYESMLREQRGIWAKYEAEYESLPLAKERRASELQLLKVTIQNKLICHKIEETKRMLKIKAQISRRVAQLKIIEFAKLYVEHKKKEICCSKLANKVQSLKFQEKELRLEVERLEKQAVESKRRDSIITKSSMLSQQLPKVDLSAYIISRDKRDDAFDNQSINSYKLEQEYVNSDIYMNQDSSQSNDTTMIENNLDKEKNSQGLLNDSMDIDDDEYHHQAQQKQHVPTKHRTADRKMNSNNHENARTNTEKHTVESNQRKINRENAMNSEEKQDQSRKSERATGHDRKPHVKNMFNNEEKRVHPNHVLDGQQQKTRHFEQVNENERRANLKNAFKGQEKEAQQPRMRNFEQAHEHERRTNGNAGKNSHGNQLDTSQMNEGSNTKRRANQFKHQSKDDEKQPMNRANPSERPIPTPAKMAKNIPEQHQQQQIHSNSPQDHRNPEQSNFRQDLLKLPQGNKPYIKSCERVNYQNVLLQGQRETAKPLGQAVPMPPIENPSSSASVIASMDQHQQQPNQPQMFRSVSMEIIQESMVNESPINSMNNMLNMESQSLISGLMEMHADANSDISMILGSEITEPGGSVELAKRFYDDLDVNSENGFNYDDMLQKFYSPVAANLRQEQSQQQQQTVDNAQSENQEQRNISFISSHTVKKPTNQSQRFF